MAGPYRAKINAATMIGQSKSAYQAEIDSACELVDFLRINVKFMQDIYRGQPHSGPGTWNRVEYNALEGFVLVRHCVSCHNLSSLTANR
jgi:1-pyrroline-5-carboxylate dehydrogenase